MGFFAVDTADRWVNAGVASSAVHDCAWVILSSVGLGTDCTSVTICGTALSGVSIDLAFVAASGGAEGDILGNLAFAVEYSKAFSTQRLLGNLPYESDDHR
jgi:hypothetical protein